MWFPYIIYSFPIKIDTIIIENENKEDENFKEGKINEEIEIPQIENNNKKNNKDQLLEKEIINAINKTDMIEGRNNNELELDIIKEINETPIGNNDNNKYQKIKQKDNDDKKEYLVDDYKSDNNNDSIICSNGYNIKECKLIQLHHIMHRCWTLYSAHQVCSAIIDVFLLWFFLCCILL